MLRKSIAAVLSFGLLTQPAWAQKEGAAEYDTDLELAAIAKQYPGFGGYFFDREGNTMLLLSDLTWQAQLSELISKRDVVNEGVTDGDPGREESDEPTLTGKIVVMPVKHDFAQLYEYKHVLTGSLSEPGAVFLDLDEVNNRILIGVDPRAASKSDLFVDITAAPRLLAEKYNVPQQVIAVTHTTPIQQIATLRDRIRPAPGGMQIAFGNSLCTMGVVVQQGNTNGFLTNSHCTSVQGGVESTAYFQANTGSSNRIGTEVRDPLYTTGGGCPAGRVCRSSDSALVQFTSNNMGLGDWGHIAKPPCYNCNSIQISTQYPRLKMVYGSRTSPPVGQVVQKIGRTTGWTRGPVSQTCVLTNVAARPQTLFCQTFVSAASAGGDSGSAVVVGSHQHRRSLRGLLWGGNGAGTFVFSPIGAVETDLGAVDIWP